MKTTIPILVLIWSALSPLFAADSSNAYTIRAFQEKKDLAASFKLITHQLDDIIAAPQKESSSKEKNDEERMSLTSHVMLCLYNNKPISRLEYTRFARHVVYHNTELVGLIEYRIMENEDKIRQGKKIKAGHLEICCIDTRYDKATLQTKLITHAITQMHDIEAQAAYIEIEQDDHVSREFFKSLGFVRNALYNPDKEYGLIKLEYKIKQ